MSESRLQEIVTKAVVGRAERRMSWSHTVPAEGITGVYGVRVTDSAVGVKDADGRPVVDMIVDCDLWCGTHKHTKVVRCTCRGSETMEVKTVGQVLGDLDLGVRLIGGARATGVTMGDGQITLSLEADVVVEMNALARMWVKAYDLEGMEILGDLDDLSTSSSSSSSSSDSSSSSSSSSSSDSTGPGFEPSAVVAPLSGAISGSRSGSGSGSRSRSGSSSSSGTSSGTSSSSYSRSGSGSGSGE